MSKLFAREARLESKSLDNIFCSELIFLSAKLLPDCLLVGFNIDVVFVGCKTSPNASNSLKNNNYDYFLLIKSKVNLE